MKLPRRKFLHLAAGTAALPAVLRSARAQAYPSRPVRIVVGYAPGGGNDIIGRLIGQWLSERLGQSFVIENRPGAASNIATAAVVNAPPDGYTLLATPPNTLTANAALFHNLSYDPATFEPVAILALGANVLAVKKDLPVKTVPELIALAKSGTLSYASQGNGSTTHLTMELFKSRTGTQITHVPYKGAAPAANDLAGGHVDTMFCDLGTILPLHRAGRVRIIATSTAKRIALLPDIPSIDESALPGFNSTTFYALMAPPGTPRAIREKLNQAIVAAMRTPQIGERLKSIFVNDSDMNLDTMDRYIRTEAELWGGVIRTAKITVEQ
jgi:tripartite-type tricarboxylate transporter receptor subunit TctC